MALLPYKSHQSPLNRSRSSSCSSPLRNRIIYQEVFSVGANTLVRSFSCNQVFNKDENGQTFQTTHIQVSSFVTPEKKKHVNDGMNKKIQIDSELLKSSTPKIEPDKVKVKSVKKTEVTEGTTKISKNRKGILRKTMKYMVLPLICAFMIYNYIHNRECSYIWDIKRTGNELKENVFGQNDALAKIDSVLTKLNSSRNFYTLVFTGGVGVGKTFSSSIIRHNFPWSFNKLITFSDSFYDDIQNMLKSDLLNCGCNLIIVDDLSVQTSNDAVNLIKLINTKLKNNENLLLILIFQVKTEDERDAVVKDLEKAYVHYHHVPFKSLTKDAVEKCYYAEIQRQKVEISEIKFKKLVEDKMSHIDIVNGPVGCKGVGDEVSSYN